MRLALSRMSAGKTIRILAFGDSLTAGYFQWGARYHPYSLKLYELLNNKFQNKNVTFEIDVQGVPGETTDSMILRMKKLLKKHTDLQKTINWALILGGSNDLPYRLDTDIFENLKQIHEQTHALGIKSVAMSVPALVRSTKQLDSSRNKLNHLIQKYATQNSDKVLFADMQDQILNPVNMTKEEIDQVFDDNIHFTEEGYDRMATILFNTLHTEIEKSFES